MINTIKKLISLLKTHELKSAIVLLIMITIMAFLDMIGIASILPFISVLTVPDLAQTNILLNNLFEISKILGIRNNEEFIFFLGTLVFILIIISLIFKSITIYKQVKFVQILEFSITRRLVEGYLYQPYSWFLNRNSADIGKTILSEVATITGNGIGPLIEIISKGIISLAIIFLLLLADPKLAIIVGFSLGGSYLIIFNIIKFYLKRIGEARLKNNQLRFMKISEAFGAVKEVKFGGLEKTYINSFSQSAEIFARTQASSNLLGLLPRFILEAIAFGGILLIVLYIIAKTGNFNNSLPIISLYVFAGYRLMPALQQIYSSFTQLAFVEPSIDKLNDDINNLNADIKSLKIFDEKRDSKILPLKNNISLKNIFYSYPNSSKNTLNNININIPAKTTVGIMGGTGGGKTTLIDIILALLEPHKGTLEVDGKIITKINSRSWQRSIGYVPQHIYLADDTVEANIAFGLEPKNINHKMVEKASKIAKLHEFVTHELPEKYKTKVGERGVRLSGGQRQRIGIARALYHNPNVLILDEATSALDNETEKEVMNGVNSLSKEITIILIAHRLNTLKNCDTIFKIEKGNIIGQFNYKDLTNDKK